MTLFPAEQHAIEAPAVTFGDSMNQILEIHRVMFEKLLSDGAVPPPLALAELLEDAANVYLGLSEQISEMHRLARGIKS